MGDLAIVLSLIWTNFLLCFILSKLDKILALLKQRSVPRTPSPSDG